ncbi:M23 family metallopeptidase [Sediminitomix flava]|uniref:LysM domain-containing protein n=1 Tax=Sediminitomix flava TaxID=379075 RepID=A0A315Z8X8_SEDFL|nr:M23 family metallopeptidase [Sediminitomix flava]PWJ40899.1 LysM domain-containing protein [Sediminitomix flava]
MKSSKNPLHCGLVSETGDRRKIFADRDNIVMKLKVILLTLFTLALIPFDSNFAQDAPTVKKKKLSRKERKALQAKLEANERYLEALIRKNDEEFILVNGEFDCEESELLRDLPKPYERINLNETEVCKDQVEIMPGKMVDAEYMLAEDYYSTWSTTNINPYKTKAKELPETVKLKLYESAYDGDWSFPTDSTRITSHYGFRRMRFHHGVDLKVQIGDPIYSVFDGVVRMARYNRGGYGYYVVIRHKNGLETLYGHLNKYSVTPGQVVKAGDIIGQGGNTGRSSGPHLHFEVRYQGNAFDPNSMFDLVEYTEDLPELFALNRDEHYKKLLKSEANVYHKIRSGDSLWKISKKYHTSVNKICRLNGMSKNSVLRVGKTIRVR